MSTFIQELPLELTLEVLGFLDNYSIITALEVWPIFRENTILITDHAFLPFFFEVPGIRRRYIRNNFCDRPSEEYYDETRDKAHFKLVECIFFYSWKYKKVLEDIFSKLDCFTHLFIKMPCYAEADSHLVVGAMIERLDQDPFTGVKYTIGCDAWHSDENNRFLNHYYAEVAFEDRRILAQSMTRGPALSSMQMRDSAEFHEALLGIKCLRVENVSLINVRLPLLEVLSVMFPYETSERFEISGLWAPHLLHFRVHYNGVFPVMRDLDEIASVDPDSFLVALYVGRSLEISDIQGLQVNSHCFKKQRHTPQLSKSLLLKTVDLSFARRFQDLHFQGIPAFLIEEALVMKPGEAEPPRVRYVRDIMVDIQLAPGVCNDFTEELVPFFPIYSLTIRVLADNVKLPRIRPKRRISTVQLFCLGNGTDCSQFGGTLDKTSAPDVALILYNSLSKARHLGGIRCVDLKLETQHFLDGLFKAGEMRMSGFRMPILMDDDLNAETGIRDNLRENPGPQIRMIHAYSAIFRPIVPQGFAQHSTTTANERLSRERYVDHSDLEHLFQWPFIEPIEWDCTLYLH